MGGLKKHLAFKHIFLAFFFWWVLQVEIGGCDLSGLRILKSEDYTYVSLGVWESKEAFKATAELPQDGFQGASRSEIHIFVDTTSAWKNNFFKKAFSDWKELPGDFFSQGWEDEIFQIGSQMTCQEESSSFATSAWIPRS